MTIRFLLRFAASLATSASSILLLAAPMANAQNQPLKIGIVGDSTVCQFPPSSPLNGWGQALPEYFLPDVTFLNQAKAGASTKTFPSERWQKILEFKPDFVLIEFGFNDQHEKTKPEATDAASDFKDNLRRFIAEAREAKISPILVTPNHRRTFTPGSVLTTELEPYVNAMKEVGLELKVPVVDLYAKSAVLYEGLGEEGSTSFTVNNQDNADRPGRGDRTHFTPEGARQMARLVADGLAETDPRLKAAAKASTQ